MLADLALSQFAERRGQRLKKLSDQALGYLQSQSWPGNVRQLTHTVERAAIFSDSEVIYATDFGVVEPAILDTLVSRTVREFTDQPVQLRQLGGDESMCLSSAVEQVEEQLIRKAMAQYNGNKKRVTCRHQPGDFPFLSLQSTGADRLEQLTRMEDNRL
ncbi:hypothetical protein [Burkholderia guangdongensis]|uniref:hypothetical protein n=1 Tax=Burkholderia guangdongensis TaxID=1792500 RepID=UPI0015C79223|nr:hypothetical protein [Burkholderia guangdongensis]